jgi:ribosomal protein S18 acetylase RimI-like enzyme
MAKVKVRRASRDELPGFFIMRDSILAESSNLPSKPGFLDLEIEVDPTLDHLMKHDPEAFLVVEDKKETLGFGSAHVRSLQCILSDLWVLPQHRGLGAGEALLSRLMAYGERNGAREYLAMSTTGGNVQSLLLRHGLKPLTPIYHFSIDVEKAVQLGAALSRLLPGTEMSLELLNRRGQADIDRIDRLSRSIIREADHLFWIKKMGAQTAFIHQGDRVAAYAYGRAGFVGPVAANSQDAALSGIGWGIDLALAQDSSKAIEMCIPATFASAVEAVLDGGARLNDTSILYGTKTKMTIDRWLPGSQNLP